MGYKLKAGKTITNDYDNSYSDAVMAIDVVKIIKAANKKTIIVIKQFHTLQARTDWKNGDKALPLNTFRYFVVKDEFDTYFDISVLADHTDIFAAGYNYLNTEKPTGSIDWSIWENDE